MFFYLPKLPVFSQKSATIQCARWVEKKHMFFGGNALPKSNARAHLKQRKNRGERDGCHNRKLLRHLNLVWLQNAFKTCKHRWPIMVIKWLPSKHEYWTNVELMLSHRLRLRANIKPALAQRYVFAGNSTRPLFPGLSCKWLLPCSAKPKCRNCRTSRRLGAKGSYLPL